MKGIIGITPGDPAGIGPEVIRRALDSGKLHPGFSYRLLGGGADCASGKPTLDSARAAFDALEESARLALAGEIDAVVTGPVSKAQMHKVGFDFPGQTEFYAARCREENFAMALVTAHVPLKEVPSLLAGPEIIRVGKLLADFLFLRLGRPPRIAVAGLNPHAGENGDLGREEIELIAPSVSELNSKSKIFHGPFPPDTVFNRAVQGEFDGVLCMYHDQGLIPLKLHAFDQGVNVTIGLPIIRTSPDHGTAFEIAGRGIARPDSMITAINLAAELAEKRNRRG
jgi:4-hydroxythreonine-4-phosphate dehydrogenase